MTSNIILSLFSLMQINMQAIASDQVEHQLRLCDTPQNIITRLLPPDNNQKKFETLYIETADLLFKKNGWVIRIRSGDKKNELSIKKSVTNDTVISGMECEYDGHADVLEKKCKLDSKISSKDLNDVLNSRKNWTELLSPAQIIILNNENVLFQDARLYGTLKNMRSKWNHSRGEVTLDISHLNSNPDITYHEVSVRYSLKDLPAKKALFHEFISSSGVNLCKNQLEWPVDKFDVLKQLN